MRLLLATRNKGKIKELKEILSPHDFEILSLDDFPDIEDALEDGETFKENAVKKAQAACEQTGLITLADDSGLEVDCLDGAPGINSARFAGDQRDDSANNQKLLELLDSVPAQDRTARFTCVTAIAVPDGWVFTAEGQCEGIIIDGPRGEGGFGYDPLFYVPDHDKTFAELGPEVKNLISHRARALEGALDILLDIRKMLEEDEEE